MIRYFATVLLAAASCGSLCFGVDFDREIRPLLSDKCFHCHGPDEATREADLRLDTREGALGSEAFVAGKPDLSEALRRVLSHDPDERMPPAESNLSLKSAEKKLLEDWVKEGANWSEHWAFVLPEKPDAPKVGDQWARSDLDRFVFARARENGLTPLPEASKETLIRRVTLDLTGLPPTLAEIDAYLADETEGAYEKLVDRLLKSPRYGERMAWEWLDAARYADTDGFQGDPTRTMWPWRDWLVEALNNNMPFDQFTVEMLAGDLLDNPTSEQILATGFNRNHMFNGEGGRIPEETRVENVFDRCETTGTVWLGLTMTCCRCHDHKYDTISQKEYFQMYAFFNNTSENGRSGRGKTAPVIQYLQPERRKKSEDLNAKALAIEKELAAPDVTLDEKQTAWQEQLIAKLGQSSTASKMGPWWQLGPIAKDGKTAYDQDLGPEARVDLAAKVEDAAWQKKPKLAEGKVVDLPETVGATYFYRIIETQAARKMQLSLGSDDAIKVFLNGKEVLAKFASRAAAADQEMLSLDLQAGENHLLIKIVNTGGIAGFYFRKVSESVLGLPTEVVTALQSQNRKPEETKRLREYYRSKNWDRWAELTKRRDQLRKQQTALTKQAVTVMVMDDLKGDKQRKTLILERGGYDKPTDVSVTANTPAVLPPLPTDAPRNRLSLAKWLVDPSNPLTARVTVNRYWQTFFGRGIVKSTEDFGTQGTRPTHPALLDWLASRFVASGWNVKDLHKTIVMSATYRQDSRLSKDAIAKDPSNVWLARSPRYRMPSWMLRDQALAISGLLNPTMGGPSVRPYQPAGIWADATFGKIKYQRDNGEKLYRRSLYIFWRRIVGPTMFFDGAKRQTCEVKPARTNTPLHALTTLNETTFVESARAMAQQLMKASDSQDVRLRTAFRQATGRRAQDHELQVLADRVNQLQKDFESQPDNAAKLLGVGESPRDEKLNVAQHAAYTVVCSILLNLDETLSRQ